MANEKDRARAELDQAERWMDEKDPRDRRVLAWALGIALALHGVLLVARMPDWGPDPMRVDAPREVAMKVQFLQPPPPQPPKPQPPKPETKKIPRPDPTPDEPEPEVEPEREPQPPESFAEPGPPAPAADMGPIRVSPGQGPGLIKRVEPVYPPAARATRLEGTVVLDAVILKDGSVSDVTVVKSANPMFDKAAMDALRQWRFTPGQQDVIMSLTVHFQLR
jgi:protein TonB